MKGFRGLLLVLAVLVPSVASAQKEPGNNKDTRSAEVYLSGAKKEPVIADQQKFYQQALEATQRGAENDPENARVWLLMGQAQIGLHNLLAADSAFDRAEKLYPPYEEEIRPYRINAWVSLYNRAIAALQAGNDAEAIGLLEEANEVYLGRPEALTMLAQLYQQQNQPEKAEQAFRQVLEILRGPARAGLSAEDEAKWAANEQESVLRLAGLLADSDRTDEAIALYQEFLKREPDNAMAKANLGVTMMRAGKAAEAAPLFNDLLDRKDLDGATLYNIGVGLFRANQYEQAARAFERVVELNPYSHDGLYNLGQTIYAGTAELEKAKEGKSGAELAALNEKLLQEYGRMGDAAQKLLALDPLNTQAIMMLAQTERSRGELTPDAAKAEEWKQATLATLEQHDAWQFEVEGLQVIPAAGKVTVMGSMKNLKAPQNTPLKLNFILLDEKGAPVAQQEISVNAPATGESERFNVEVPAPEAAISWKYTVVN